MQERNRISPIVTRLRRLPLWKLTRECELHGRCLGCGWDLLVPLDTLLEIGKARPTDVAADVERRLKCLRCRGEVMVYFVAVPGKGLPGSYTTPSAASPHWIAGERRMAKVGAGE